MNNYKDIYETLTVNRGEHYVETTPTYDCENMYILIPSKFYTESDGSYDLESFAYEIINKSTTIDVKYKVEV